MFCKVALGYICLIKYIRLVGNKFYNENWDRFIQKDVFM